MSNDSLPRLDSVQQDRHHFGDPCIHCDTPHDDVAVGPCPGREPPFVTVAGYCSLGVRWDGVEHYRYRMSSGEVREVHSHVSNHSPYYHFGLSTALVNPPPYDVSLRASPESTQ